MSLPTDNVALMFGNFANNMDMETLLTVGAPYFFGALLLFGVVILYWGVTNLKN